MKFVLLQSHHVSGFEQLSKGSTSFRQPEEQPSDLGHCNMGTVHNIVHSGYPSTGFPNTEQQGEDGKL
jgi:hypothetical protein